MSHPGPPALAIRLDDLSGEATRALVAAHIVDMHRSSPAESVHALEADALRDPSITVWSAWVGERIAGIAALKALEERRGEVKSMRVDDAFRGTGVGRQLLRHLIASARKRGLASLWLETGSPEEFIPAQRLYESEGFIRCGPFGDYVEDPFSVYMTRDL